MNLRLKIALVAALGLSACSSDKTARHALTAQGFTDIETHGYSVFGCSDNDTVKTKFTATNTNGQRVSGVVCSGLIFKNATIRW